MFTKIKKRAFTLLSATILATTVSVTSFAAINEADAIQQNYSYSTEMRGLTAFQIVNDMGAGWNLGNSLEAENDETRWGNPKTTKKMIDGIAAMGFTTLRVPVRWDDNYSDASTYTVKTSYMDRVEEVVNYGLDNGMYVILNVHHNDLQHNVPDTENISMELTALWTQIGNRFKDYGDKLIFEVNNEPRGYTNGNEDWTGNSEYYECVNQCNEAARAAIRSTGGNNAKRLVMLPTYCASGDAAKAEAWTKNANDDMIAVSIHAYLPMGFAFLDDAKEGAHSEWLESDAQDLEYFFERMNKYFISKGIPVVIGEFGATNKNNTAEREKWAKAYISFARRFPEQDIPCVVWDNHYVDINNPGEEQFKLYDRYSCTFTYEGIARAITSGYDGDPDYETVSSGDIVILNTPTALSNWSNSGFSGDYITGMLANESIVVNYTGDIPILILQSWSGGGSWVKVYPSSTSNGSAYFTYNDLLSAYGGSFALVNKAYVSATEGSTSVTKVYIPKTAIHTHIYNGIEKVTLEATATTYGRKLVSCSVNGCDTCAVKLIDPVAADRPEAPAAPQNVKASAGEAKVQVKWDAVANADSYMVQVYDGAVCTSYNTTATSYMIRGLTNGTRYGFSVKACTNEVYSEESTVVYAVPYSTVPQNVRAGAGDSKVQIKWDAVPNASSYRVMVNSGSGWYGINTTSTSVMVRNLTNGKQHAFAVKANIGGAYSAVSNIVYATPAVDATIPQNVRVGAGDCKVQVKWDTVTGASSYRVMVYDGSSWGGVNTTSTSLMVRNLTNGKKYAFAVKAYINGAYSDTSTVVYATPTADGSIIPQNFSVSTGNGKAQLSWSAVSGATSYRVMVFDGKSWVGYNTTATSYTVSGLTNGTKYGFTVKAYVNGAYSDTCTVVYGTPNA